MAVGGSNRFVAGGSSWVWGGVVEVKKETFLHLTPADFFFLEMVWKPPMSFVLYYFQVEGGINQMIMGEQGNLWQFIYAYTVEQQSSPTIEPLKDSTETVQKTVAVFYVATSPFVTSVCLQVVCVAYQVMILIIVIALILLLMEAILHQLRLVVYLIIYRVLYIQTVVVWDFWTINSSTRKLNK